MRAWSKAHPQLWQFILFNVFANCATGGCGHFLGPLILRYPHLSCCYKSLALSVLNWTQPSEGKLNSFFCVPVYIFIENLDKLLDSNISP